MLRRKFYPAATRYLLQAIEKWDGEDQDLAQVIIAFFFLFCKHQVMLLPWDNCVLFDLTCMRCLRERKKFVCFIILVSQVHMFRLCSTKTSTEWFNVGFYFGNLQSSQLVTATL